MRRTRTNTKVVCAEPVGVEFVSLPSRQLITIGPDSPLWQIAGTEAMEMELERLPSNAFVRLIPPHDATDARIAYVRGLVQNVTRLAPRAAAPSLIPSDQQGEAGRQLAVPHRAPRVVLDAMLARVDLGEEDRAALAQLVERYVSRAEAKRPVSLARRDVGYITGIRLENWMCFAGVQELTLESLAYSITASETENEERSNWLGKSSLLAAIVFALTGEYPTPTADGWIHNGEPKGGVDLEFSSGLFVSRWKKRGTSTQLEVVGGADAAPLTGSAAERYLTEEVIDLNNLRRTSWFGQKQIDAFLRMGPAELSETFNRWLDLSWLEEAGEECRADLSKLTLLEQKFTDELARIRQRYEISDGDGSLDALRARLAEAQSSLERLTGEIEVCRGNLPREGADPVAEWRRHKVNSDKYERAEEQLAALVIPEPVEDEEMKRLDEAQTKAVGEEHTARNDHAAATRAARGEFDGVCPVAGIRCPAQETINKSGAPARELAAKRLVVLEAARQVASAASVAARSAYDQRQERKVALRRAEQLKSELAQHKASREFILANSREPLLDTEKLAHERSLREAYEAAVQSHANAKVAHDAMLRSVSDYVIALREVNVLAPLINRQRHAMQLLGRNGVQRELAETALAQIQAYGNEALSAAGITLGFQILWSRETKSLATSCDSCGAAFPSSAKVKQCERCAAPRGKALSNAVSIQLSNRSGGADDLVGVMLQLAASRWLRQYENLPWGIYLLDEPFGALDRANMRALASHLVRLLGDQFGAVQSFIVAHHADALESTPGRIHITSEGGRSKVVVLGR